MSWEHAWLAHLFAALQQHAARQIHAANCFLFVRCCTGYDADDILQADSAHFIQRDDAPVFAAGIRRAFDELGGASNTQLLMGYVRAAFIVCACVFGYDWRLYGVRLLYE